MIYKPPFLLPFDSDVIAPPAYRVSAPQTQDDGGEPSDADTGNVTVDLLPGVPVDQTVSVPSNANVDTASPDLPQPISLVSPLAPATATDADGSDLIAVHGAEINRFVAQQRQQFQLGVATFQRRRASFDGLDVFYTNNAGQETIHYAPTAKTAGGPGAAHVMSILDGLAVEFFDGAS